MPGLVGIASGGLQSEAIRASVRAMQERVAHQPFHRLDPLYFDEHVCAGRTHLGLARAPVQPFRAGDICVWLEGEFHNREELWDGPGDETGSDPEILLGMLEKGGGPDLLGRIDGIYSAVVYDARRRTLRLLSDRHGLRHLFWCVHRGRLAWASELKALLALPGFEATIDREALRDFLDVGYHRCDRSWFAGVELLPPATLLSWDLERGRLARQRYWSRHSVAAQPAGIDEDEAALELGRRFMRAVAKRARPGERVGLALSGGLDSRAVLAALPEHAHPVHALTFGQRGCLDLELAARAAAVSGARHHVFELDRHSWLTGRLPGIWASDGQLCLLHLHGLPLAERARSLFALSLSGFIGDLVAGGSHLGDSPEQEFAFLDGHVRRFTIQGPRMWQGFTEVRFPFVDNDVYDFVYGLPRAWRVGSRLYNRMLLACFPDHYRSIPWQTTGAPISPDGMAGRGSPSRLRQLARPWLEHLRLQPLRDMADYAHWMRSAPGRSFFESLLLGRDSCYGDFVERQTVEAAWQALQRGVRNAEHVARLATFEIWLRQLFLGELRSEP
jgi:asparagine synthase (glutamine-hydrolysing)